MTRVTIDGDRLGEAQGMVFGDSSEGQGLTLMHINATSTWDFFH